MRTAVWKVGGSLFDLADFIPRLSRLLSESTGQRVLLVPGGGGTADIVRKWQQRTQIDDATAHWLAVDALDFNSQLLVAALPRGEVIQTPAQATGCWQRGRVPVLAASTWLLGCERDQFVLPHTWAVTSDSIAAWVAARWSFDELVLLKSVSLGSNVNVTDATERGLVDHYFREIVVKVPRIAWCNLREDCPVIHDWLIAGVPVSA